MTGDLDDYRYQVKALRGGDASQGSNVAGVLQSAHAGAIVPLADVTLISNLGQSSAGSGNFTNDQAQAFTTGSNSGGYSLTKVVINSHLGLGADFTVSVHENDSGAPGTSLGTLTNPTLPFPNSQEANYEFTHSGIGLAASTTYFIVVDVGASSATYLIYNTSSDAEDTGGATGWSIGDSSLYRGFGSTGSWTTWAQSKRISITGTTNNAPVFADATTTRSVPENSAVGTNVGSAVTATDADSDTLEYTLEGTDAASFAIVSTSGQIQTKTGVTYNHEGTSSYSVTVKADDGNGGTDTIGVTITVSDVDEAPSAPGAPDVTAASGTTDSLVVDWKEPANTGPAINDYDVQYRKSSDTAWTAHAHAGTATTTTITGLEASTSYQVHVLAKNAEGTSDWSASGTGSTGTSATGALISNVGQTEATGVAQVSATQSQAQGFTTGSDSGGYTLGSVELAVSSFSGTASDITVSIYSESSGHPGTVVHTLTTPASISAAVTTFTAPSGATLAASTTYYVVISTTGSGISLSRTDATAEDTGGVSGWSIADSRRFFGAGGWNTTTRPIRMRVNGPAATSTNSPATGAPTITGTPAVGELLTADISNIGDSDGIADADFEYQWIAFDGTTDSDISGATGETYRPLLAHLAQTIKVRVTFDDDDDNAESLTSAPTAAVTASTYGQVIWAATLTVEEVIDGSETYLGFDFLHSQGSLEPSYFSYDSSNNISVDWLYYDDVLFLLRVGLPGYSGLGSGSFNLYLDDSGFLIQDPASNPLDENFHFSDHGLTWTDEQEVEVRLTVNRPATGAPAITGKPEVGETLTAGISGIMDEDGLPVFGELTYQWISNDGTDDSDIDGATDSTYTLVEADAGKTIKVRVSFTDNAKFPESLTSTAVTVPVAAGETALVSNTGQSNNGYNTITSTTPKRAQAFTTGTNELGYTLSSIGISFGTISSDSNPTSELTATLNKVDGSNPGDVICTLTDPASYVASSVNTYQAPAARCPTLTASTTYFFVISRANDTTSIIQLDRTNSNSEDADPAVGWSIADSRRFFTNDAWTPPGVPSAHRIAVTGAAVLVPPPTEVPSTWSLIPSGLQEGDQFRLLFISSMHRSASPSEIATYNTWIQARAANGHTDIQDYSSSFRAVGSTEDMDARDNTGTTYTSSDKGVAIYWLGGNKVADDYEDFYDEDWDEEAAMKNESGTAETGVSAWTGSDHDGTEMLQGTPETSRALGNSNNAWVRFGKTDSASHGPLSGATANRTDDKRIYGLSGVFEVVAGNNPATGAPTISGTPQVGELLTADASNIGDPDGISGATFSYQWIAHDGTDDADIDGATKSTYWPSAGDVGNTIKVKVSFTDDEDNAESVTSEATDTVAGPAVTAVPADWSLIPDGLEAGDRFRLLFLSSATRNAVPTDIDTYNTWIQDRVDAGHTDIQDYTETFRAVGCTAAVDARDDTGTTYTSDDKGVPIYWLNGDKAADEYEDFYDETWHEEASMRDESGTTVSAPGSVWTGCGHDGTERFGAGMSLALGSFSVIYGVPNSDATNAGPLSSSNSTSRTGQRPFYGLSGVFSVSPPGKILYSASLTVEEETVSGTGTFFGYNLFDGKGGLEPNRFRHGANTLFVSLLVYLEGDTLRFSFSGGGLGSDDFNLYLDGARFLIESPGTDPDLQFSDHGLSWTNGQIVRVWLTVNREPKLTISGTTLVGQTLTATIDEPDGLPPSDQITYQWIRVDGNTESDISGETGSTYTLVDADEGKTIKVEASYTDNANFAESLTSDATAVISSGPSVGTVTSGMITQTSAVITVTIANPDTNTQTVNLQYKRNADTNWTSGGARSTVSAAVTFTLSSLTGNTDYDVRASLDSTFASGVVTATFKTSPVKPAPPTGVAITTEGNGELTVGWTAPTENGGSDITGYKVQWKSGTQSFGTARSTLTADGAATSYTIPSLTNGTEYTVRVLAVNAAGDSAASNTDTGTPSTTPSAPTNVLASGNAELTVTWDAPDDGGSAITGYTVQWKSGTQNYNTTSRQATVTTTTHTIPSLTNDTTYTLRVKATNANGDSGWTEITATPLSGPGVAR